MYIRTDEPQPKFPEINHNKECQEPISRPTDLLTFHSHKKIRCIWPVRARGQLHGWWLPAVMGCRLCNGTGKSFLLGWVISAGGKFHIESSLPTSPEHHHQPRASVQLGNISGSWFQSCTRNIRMCCWEDEILGTLLKREEGELAVRVWYLLTPFLPLSLAQDLLPQNKGPFGVASASLAIYPHIADTKIHWSCFYLSFEIDLKPWSSHTKHPASLR